MLSGNSAMASNMARGLLEKLPQEKKDELVVQLLTKNRDKLLGDGPHCRREKRHPPADLRCIGEENLTSPARNGAPRGYPGFSCCHCTRSVL